MSPRSGGSHVEEGQQLLAAFGAKVLCQASRRQTWRIIAANPRLCKLCKLRFSVIGLQGVENYHSVDGTIRFLVEREAR